VRLAASLLPPYIRSCPGFFFPYKHYCLIPLDAYSISRSAATCPCLLVELRTPRRMGAAPFTMALPIPSSSLQVMGVFRPGHELTRSAGSCEVSRSNVISAELFSTGCQMILRLSTSHWGEDFRRVRRGEQFPSNHASLALSFAVATPRVFQHPIPQRAFLKNVFLHPSPCLSFSIVIDGACKLVEDVVCFCRRRLSAEGSSLIEHCVGSARSRSVPVRKPLLTALNAQHKAVVCSSLA